jgi:uncharacterized protein (TIGR00369 family)
VGSSASDGRSGDVSTNERQPVDVEAARAAFERAAAGQREVFGDFFLARLFGFEISYPDEGCEVRFAVRDFMFNPQGSLHGGVLATALDIAMGHLLHRQAGAGATLEFKVQYVAAVRAGHVTCRGAFTKRGRSISFLRAEARDDAGELVAFATATWKLLRAESG